MTSCTSVLRLKSLLRKVKSLWKLGCFSLISRSKKWTLMRSPLRRQRLLRQKGMSSKTAKQVFISFCLYPLMVNTFHWGISMFIPYVLTIGFVSVPFSFTNSAGFLNLKSENYWIKTEKFSQNSLIILNQWPQL